MTRSCALLTFVASCTRIAAYIEGLDAAGFGLDLKPQDAVISHFKIIGKAVKGSPRDAAPQDVSIPLNQIAGIVMFSLIPTLR